jgi:integrase
MRVFRQQYKDRNGKTQPSAKWYVELRNHRRIVCRFPGFTDKGATAEMGRRLRKLIEWRIAGGSLDAEMSKWLESTPDELTTLLTTTRGGPVRHKLTGLSRAMLYRVAMETGLRRKELRTLTPASFDFDSATPTVYVEPGQSKNRGETLLPIRRELVAELREWFQSAEMAPDTALWPDLTNHTAKMLKADLEAAGMAYVDDVGLFADFDSLRHSFISMLAAGNVHPKLAQRLARHSDINLTMMRYSHTLIADEATALEALPKLPSAFSEPATQSVSLKATGTDPTAGENVLPVCLPEQVAQS